MGSLPAFCLNGLLGFPLLLLGERHELVSAFFHGAHVGFSGFALGAFFFLTFWSQQHVFEQLVHGSCAMCFGAYSIELASAVVSALQGRFPWQLIQVLYNFSHESPTVQDKAP